MFIALSACIRFSQLYVLHLFYYTILNIIKFNVIIIGHNHNTRKKNDPSPMFYYASSNNKLKYFATRLYNNLLIEIKNLVEN